MKFFNKSLAGPGFIILNTIRIMNIIALLAVIAASWVMIVKTFVVSKFFFFDGTSHVITSSTGIFLIVSEFPLFRSYFIRNWPLLSPNSGFVTLGVAMIILGVSILGHLNKEATSQESLGLAFWRIVISSGIVVIVLGFINIVCSYIFRDPHTGISARMVRSYGAVAAQKLGGSDIYRSSSTHSRKSFHLGRSDTLPSYHTSPKTSTTTETRQHQPRLPLNISGPVNVDNAQFGKFAKSPDVERPGVVFHHQHPALFGGRI
ncbi:hypothetical protein MMC16_000663 [Acarospora aff. strigata]|nr:hypothetical protein [Acarospora aff. strigata]